MNPLFTRFENGWAVTTDKFDETVVDMICSAVFTDIRSQTPGASHWTKPLVVQVFVAHTAVHEARRFIDGRTGFDMKFRTENTADAFLYSGIQFILTFCKSL